MNNKGKTILLICVTILVIIGTILVVYKELNVEETYIPEKKENNETGKEILKTDERVIEAYKKIYKKTLDDKGRDSKFNIYRNKKVTFDNIDDLYVYLAVTSSLSELDAKTTTLPNSNTESYIIDLNLFNNKLASLYGNVKYTLARRLDESELNVVNGLGYSCNNVTEDSINCNTKKEKPTSKDRIFGYIEKTEESEHYIYIYEKEIYIENTLDNDFTSVNLYSNDILLATSVNIKDKIEKLSKNETTEEEIIKELELKYNNLTTYKHTFMKTPTGDTYWVSTEPIEQY